MAACGKCGAHIDAPELDAFERRAGRGSGPLAKAAREQRAQRIRCPSCGPEGA